MPVTKSISPPTDESKLLVLNSTSLDSSTENASPITLTPLHSPIDHSFRSIDESSCSLISLDHAAEPLHLPIQKPRSSSDSTPTIDGVLLQRSRVKKQDPQDITQRTIPYRLWGRYLRPNAAYVGEQQSGKARYKITVRFKTVDLKDSLVTGYLKINGLTEHHPEITTFFKGEIINNPLHQLLRLAPKDCDTSIDSARNSFLTENRNWGSCLANDLDHWRKLSGSALMPNAALAKRLRKVMDGTLDTNYVYMRWKEEFLVPDSRIKQIHGASFEGFYYIVLCIGTSHLNIKKSTKVLDMEPGTINGLYYHKSLERFQSLSLRHVPDHGTSNVFSFC